MPNLLLISTTPIWEELLGQHPRIAPFLLPHDKPENATHILITPDNNSLDINSLNLQTPRTQFCFIIETQKNVNNLKHRQILVPCRLADFFEQVELFLFPTHPKNLSIGAWELDTDHCLLRQDHLQLELSETENAILCHLAQSSPNSSTRDALLAEILGYHPDANTHALETHIYRLRQKLQNLSNAPSINTTEDGYRLIST